MSESEGVDVLKMSPELESRVRHASEMYASWVAARLTQVALGHFKSKMFYDDVVENTTEVAVGDAVSDCPLVNFELSPANELHAPLELSGRMVEFARAAIAVRAIGVDEGIGLIVQYGNTVEAPYGLDTNELDGLLETACGVAQLFPIFIVVASALIHGCEDGTDYHINELTRERIAETLAPFYVLAEKIVTASELLPTSVYTGIRDAPVEVVEHILKMIPKDADRKYLCEQVAKAIKATAD